MSEDEAESLGELLESWEKIRYYLGLSKKDIATIKKCSMGDYELEKCDALRRWASKVKQKATPNKLIKAAVKAGEKLFARNVENYFTLKSSNAIEMVQCLISILCCMGRNFHETVNFLYG